MRTTVVVVGAGQAGLATSACLTRAGVDHAVLERATTAHSWRTQRWDSLRLLTPNWMTRLPGYAYGGGDPDGYLRAVEVADLLDGYARTFDVPVHPGTSVTRIEAAGAGFRVDTDGGPWRCRAVVLATGNEGGPAVPDVARALPARLQQATALRYRGPADVVPGRVLVVGASASGLQIADELRRAGRPVTVAVGEHVRVPRRYRGWDVYRWMDVLGLLDERYDEVDDVLRVRRLPSLQLAGTPQQSSLDLAALSAAGVELIGRLVGVAGGRAQFSGSLANLVKAADLKQGRLLDRIDAFVDECGLADRVGPPDRPAPTPVPPVVTELDLDRFAAVVWATGHRPRFPWLDPALLDPRGGLRHEGGVLPVAGMYVLGMPFTRRRRSNLLGGVGTDARELCAHLVEHLRGPVAAGASWHRVAGDG